jgi:hypothetical protein
MAGPHIERALPQAPDPHSTLLSPPPPAQSLFLARALGATFALVACHPVNHSHGLIEPALLERQIDD